MPTSNLAAGHLDRGYAMMFRTAQGLTADEALVLATDDMYQEARYTALNQARFGTRGYVAAIDFDHDQRIGLSRSAQHATELPSEAALGPHLGRNRADRLAVDQLTR